MGKVWPYGCNKIASTVFCTGVEKKVEMIICQLLLKRIYDIEMLLSDLF